MQQIKIKNLLKIKLSFHIWKKKTYTSVAKEPGFQRE
jgi:hypothetical protein